MKKLGVWEPSSLEECLQMTGRPPVSTRWVDVDKGMEGRVETRSRLVARDFMVKGDKREVDTFADGDVGRGGLWRCCEGWSEVDVHRHQQSSPQREVGGGRVCVRPAAAGSRWRSCQVAKVVVRDATSRKCLGGGPRQEVGGDWVRPREIRDNGFLASRVWRADGGLG